MKRRLLFLLLIAVFAMTGECFAAELNIYASGLRLNGEKPVTGENQVHIDYFLNAPATELKFLVFAADATDFSESNALESVTIPAVTTNVNNYNKGAHSNVVVDLSGFEGGGSSYKWAIKAKAEATASLTQVSTTDTKFILYAPKGVTVNTYPETDAFGTIYASMPRDGQSTGSYAGSTTTSKNQKHGIFVWDAGLNLQNTNNEGYAGDLANWANDDVAAAFRLKVAENGDLYMGACHSATHNLYKISSDFSTFTPLLGHAPKVSGIEILGNTIYVYEGVGYDSNKGCLGALKQYSLSNLPVVSAGTTYFDSSVPKTGNANNSIDSDGRGGFWICQNRSSDATTLPILAHVNANKSFDYNSKTASLGLSSCTRGAMGVSPDKTLLALCTGSNGAKKIFLYSISWSDDATPVPSLTKITEIATGNNVDGIAFDYANNLYSVNSSRELLYVWATAKSTNSCITPAASTRTITLGSYLPLHGTYKIGGTNADFSSLSSAVSTMNANGIDGNVTLLVCADLAENANIGLTNNTDYSITIRPDAAVKRTITFGEQADNPGPSGHLMIGYNLTGWAASPAKNIFIDGSYNNEGQYLEFVAGVKSQGGIVACFYGHVTDSYIKNCRLINNRTAGNTNNAVQFRVEQLTGGTVAAANKTDNAPEGVGLENCYLKCSGTSGAYAIQFNGSNAATQNTGGPNDCYIKNCEILGSQYGIRFNGAHNATIEGNTFRLTASPSGVICSAIFGSVINGTVSIKGNKFIENKSANTTDGNYGLQTITASGTGGPTFVIENNYFAGMDATASGASSKKMNLAYIRCGSTCEIRHNTFYMPSLQNKPATLLSSTQTISCVWIAAGSPKIENNLFVSAETEAHNSLIRGTINENVKNNVFYHAGGNAAIVAAGDATKTTWEEFTAGNANAGSKWAEPQFANAATGDLAIIESDDNLKVARLANILEDIDGNDRPAQTYAGACEPVGVSSITGVPATYTLDDLGDTHTFTAVVNPANTTFKTITWSSNNEAVVTVSATGLITAISKGEATITASAGGVSVSCVVTVAAANSLIGEKRIGGANADFASLHAACEAINTYGIIGDVTLLICADLNETQNSGLVNNTDYSITIRPDADADRTIAFSQSTANAGPKGAFVIGTASENIGWTATPTRNITIDGLASSTATHKMVIKTTNAFVTSTSPVVFYGKVTNSTIKNCHLINEKTSGSNYAITFQNEKDKDNTPEGLIVENNVIESVTSVNGQGVYLLVSNAASSAGRPKNIVIQNNEIRAATRGIFIYGANGLTIMGNTFKVNQTQGGRLSSGIMGLVQSGTITVRENKFVELTTINATENGDFGIQAILADGGATKWVIENNYFGGFDAGTASSGKKARLTGVVMKDPCVIRHNTFEMPVLSNKPTGVTYPVTLLHITGGTGHVIENNILVSHEAGTLNSLVCGSLASTASFANNVLYCSGSAKVVDNGDNSADDFEELSSEQQSANSWQQVTFSETYKIANTYAGNAKLAVPQAENLYTDIEGNARAEITHAGCYEPDANWQMALDEAATDNETLITRMDDADADVTINRRFTANGTWYTFVLPFDVDAAQMRSIFGDGYRLAVLEDVVQKSENALFLRFGYTQALRAGVPCLIQPAQDITSDILFHNVTINADEPNLETPSTLVTMIGLYDKTDVEQDIRHYYLGASDLLYPYHQTITTKGFRAYFEFSNIVNPSNCSARVVFHSDMTTDLEEYELDAPAVQKLIRDGQLIIIRDGNEYNVQGELIR